MAAPPPLYVVRVRHGGPGRLAKPLALASAEFHAEFHAETKWKEFLPSALPRVSGRKENAEFGFMASK